MIGVRHINLHNTSRGAQRKREQLLDEVLHWKQRIHLYREGTTVNGLVGEGVANNDKGRLTVGQRIPELYERIWFGPPISLESSGRNPERR